jgi:mono/diheme cytochrome c family protein
MPKVRKALFSLACASALFVITPAAAQQQAKHPGVQLLRDKCFQCHTDAMWRDSRQDARWWEAALYRMVGRGGLWTTEEIKLMADYLGTDFGPGKPPNELRK